MSNKGLTLEERLLHNAVDTVVKNRDDYDAPVLIHLVQELVSRPDLAPSLYRILCSALTPAELKSMGVNFGMVGTGNDAMNYLTIPQMHRTLLRGVQQMQEKLLPGGFLLQNKDIDHADATRMLRDCTGQLEKILRLTKAVRANAEIFRLKEAIATGLEAIGKDLGKDVQAEAFRLMNDAIRDTMARTKLALEDVMEEAESMN